MKSKYVAVIKAQLIITVALAGFTAFPTTAHAVAITGQDYFNGAESEMHAAFYKPGSPGQACSVSSGGSLAYRSYTFKSDSSGGVGANLMFDNCSQNLYATFYEGDFNPDDICSGFLWSHGSAVNSFSGSFAIAPNKVVTMVVSNVAASYPKLTCGPYSYIINGATPFSRNIALRKLKATNSAITGKDSWQASYAYSADRRDANIFDPTADSFSILFGNKSIEVPAGNFIKQSSGVLTYKSPANSTPYFSVKITPNKQRIDVSVSKIDDFGFELPGSEVKTEITLGKHSFDFTTLLSSTGTYVPFYSYKNDNFVITSNTMKNVNQASLAEASISMKSFLESPRLLSNFVFSDCTNNCNHPSVILAFKENGKQIAYKNMSNLIAATKTIDKKTGKPIYTLKKIGKDSATVNNLSSFSYSSKTGALNIAMSKVYATFHAMTKYQSPLTVELIVNGDTFTTNITMFAADIDNFNYSSNFTKISPL